MYGRLVFGVAKVGGTRLVESGLLWRSMCEYWVWSSEGWGDMFG